MAINLASYIESINNPNGRFRTIKAVYPLKHPNGEPIMFVGDISADFEVMIRRERYWLRCILSASEEEKERLKKVAMFVDLIDSDYLEEFTYLEEEILIFNSTDSYQYNDILIERIPSGFTIDQLIGNLYESEREIPAAKLMKQLAALSGWLYENQFAHGKMMRKAIIVDPTTFELKLTDYTYARRAIPVEELKDILILVLQLYLVGCDYRLSEYFTLKRRESRSLGEKNFIQYLPQLIDGVENEATPELMAILYELQERNIKKNPEQIVNWIKIVSELEFTNYNTLSSRVDLMHQSGAKDRDLHVGERLKRYQFVAEMQNMLIRVFDGEWWKYLDKAGEVVISGEFLDAFDFHEGRAVVETKSGYGLIDVDGEFVVNPLFDDIEYDHTSGLIIVTTKGESGILDRGGNVVTELVYDLILTPREGLIPVRKDKKFGFIDYKGKMVIPMCYNDAFSFRDGVARVVYKERDYLIDTKGEIVSELHEHMEPTFAR